MSTRILSCLSFGVWAVSLGSACDEVEWQGPEYIDSLRVLGVRAEPPTLTPGASTRLWLICADGSRGAGKDPTCDAEVAWFARCDNPEHNDPDRCYDRYTSWADVLAPHVADTSVGAYPEGFGLGPSFDFAPPDGILSQKTSLDASTVRYGTSYVYFAVCSGELVTVHGAQGRLPVECRERETGRVLDHRSFVVGVTTLYTYDRITSQNPLLLAPRFDEVRLPEECTSGSDCPDGFECSAQSACVPVVRPCQEEDSDRCEEHCLDFGLGLDSFSLFSIDGTPLDAPQKSLWLSYFTNAGTLPDDAGSFAVHPPTGAAQVERTECIRWQAPPRTTEDAHLWAVVRDDRGGLAAYDQRIIVR
jgi:hypothetical protein